MLGSFLRALGTPDERIPETLEERAALYRSTLAGRRVLVLLDNARDAAQVRPLLPGTEGCAALVTSRIRMVDLAGAHLVDLDVMSPEEALQLFTRIVGEERVRAEREAALDVVGACGFLPLAIRIAASRLAARRTWTVSVLAAKLADERRRLDELQAGDLAVKATFELGYGQLEPAQARAFRLLGLADGPDVSLAAAAAALDLPEHEAEDLLEALVDTSLLESAAPGRYRFHDLVRLYARACAERDEHPGGAGGGDVPAAGLLPGHRGPRLRRGTARGPPGGPPGADAAGGGAGLRGPQRRPGLAVRGSALPAGLRAAGAARPAAPARRGPAVGGAGPGRVGGELEGVRVGREGSLDAALRSGDTRTEGRARTVLTNVHLVAGRYEAADEEAAVAARLAQAAGDAAPVYWSHNDRGIIAAVQGRYEAAEELLGRAKEGARADGNAPVEASALCNLSRTRVALGRTAQGIALAEEGIAIYERVGHTLRLANARYALGWC